MEHDEISELLASFALDAVDPLEQIAIEAHLQACPRCRAEVDAHREVAAALGNSVEPLPDGLWDSIARRLPERHDDELPPMPQLLPRADDGEAPSPAVRVGASRGRFAVVTVGAVAAAAVAAVLGINLARADNQVSHLQQAIAEPTAVEAALETPGHHLIDLDNSAGRQVVQFVTVPDGRGYLVSSRLAALPAGETYQLWGVISGKPISLGLMGQSPDQVTYTVASSSEPSKLGITVEPATGTVAPTSAMVASGLA